MVYTNKKRIDSSFKKKINSVNGSIDCDQMGISLTHEHIMSNYGAEITQAGMYNENAAFEQIIPYLKKIKANNIQTIFDCTTNYFGRRVDLLQRISDSTGVTIITNTGYYGAANDKYIPSHAYIETAIQIAQRWINEFEKGIDGTNIKPGFIKLAFDNGKPSIIDKKLFEAGVITHKKTGLTMAVHTGDNLEAIKFQLKMLKKHHVSFGALVWVHANKSNDVRYMLELAGKGLWISLDGLNDTNIKEYLNLLIAFKNKNVLHKILLSHDGNSFPNGGKIRPFDAIINLIPLLKTKGFTDSEIDQLLITNPKNAFTSNLKTN